MAHVLVMGASCGIGLETVKPGLRAGHSVRALARSAASIAIQDAALENVSGDALDSDMIRDALQGIDAAIQTLGIDIPPSPRGGPFLNIQLYSRNVPASWSTV